MKTWKSFYLLALAATLAFTGCKKDDEDEGASQTGKLTVGQTEYTLGRRLADRHARERHGR